MQITINLPKFIKSSMKKYGYNIDGKDSDRMIELAYKSYMQYPSNEFLELESIRFLSMNNHAVYNLIYQLFKDITKCRMNRSADFYTFINIDIRRVH